MSLRAGIPTILTGIDFGDVVYNSDITLSEDVYGRTISFKKSDPGDPDFTVEASGCRIIAKEKIYVGEGVTVSFRGINASGTTPGSLSPWVGLKGGGPGGAGVTTNDDGESVGPYTEGLGGDGGAGGDAGSNTGGSGAAVFGQLLAFAGDRSFLMSTQGLIFNTSMLGPISGGGGGGGGAGSSGAASSGAGGGGGGCGLFMAPRIENWGTITARGGNGSNASSDGSGGGGGGGGVVIFTYGHFFQAFGSTINVNGGNGGNGTGGEFGGKGGLNGYVYHFPASEDLNGSYVIPGSIGSDGTP